MEFFGSFILVLVAGIAFLILLMFIAYYAFSIIYQAHRISASPNEAVVVEGRERVRKKDQPGSEIRKFKIICGESIFLPPWIKVIDRFNLSSRELEINLENVSTEDQIAIDMKIVVIFKVSDNPEMLRIIVKRFKEKEIEKLVSKIISGRLRRFIAGVKIENLLTERKDILDKINKSIGEHLIEQGFELNNLSINWFSDEKYAKEEDGLVKKEREQIAESQLLQIKIKSEKERHSTNVKLEEMKTKFKEIEKEELIKRMQYEEERYKESINNKEKNKQKDNEFEKQEAEREKEKIKRDADLEKERQTHESKIETNKIEAQAMIDDTVIKSENKNDLSKKLCELEIKKQEKDTDRQIRLREAEIEKEIELFKEEEKIEIQNLKVQAETEIAEKVRSKDLLELETQAQLKEKDIEYKNKQAKLEQDGKIKLQEESIKAEIYLSEQLREKQTLDLQTKIELTQQQIESQNKTAKIEQDGQIELKTRELESGIELAKQIQTKELLDLETNAKLENQKTIFATENALAEQEGHIKLRASEVKAVLEIAEEQKTQKLIELDINAAVAKRDAEYQNERQRIEQQGQIERKQNEADAALILLDQEVDYKQKQATLEVTIAEQHQLKATLELDTRLKDAKYDAEARAISEEVNANSQEKLLQIQVEAFKQHLLAEIEGERQKALAMAEAEEKMAQALNTLDNKSKDIFLLETVAKELPMILEKGLGKDGLALDKVFAAIAKPMERIDSIKIMDLGGSNNQPAQNSSADLSELIDLARSFGLSPSSSTNDPDEKGGSGNKTTPSNSPVSKVANIVPNVALGTLGTLVTVLNKFPELSDTAMNAWMKYKMISENIDSDKMESSSKQDDDKSKEKSSSTIVN